MKTIEQRIAQKENELARLKKKQTQKENGAKYAVGGALIATAFVFENRYERDFLISLLENLTRKQDKDRTSELLQQLKQLANEHDVYLYEQLEEQQRQEQLLAERTSNFG